jgi:hypothetical protein
MKRMAQILLLSTFLVCLVSVAAYAQILPPPPPSGSPTPPPPVDGTGVPVDGGVIALLAAAAFYGRRVLGKQ